jgi:hypothetical protein
MDVKLFLSSGRQNDILRVFDNRELRRIFGSKKEDVIGGWRTLCNEQFNTWYSSPNIIRMIRWAEHIAHTGERRKIWSGNLKGA